MTIQTNTTNRKALAKAIAEALHTEYRYLRMPTYAYEVGGFIIDRYGNITGEDFTAIRDVLLANGCITEEAEINGGSAMSEVVETPSEGAAPALATDADTGYSIAEEGTAEDTGVDYEAYTTVGGAQAEDAVADLEDGDADPEATVDDSNQCVADAEGAAGGDADSEAPVSMLSNIDEQVITIPAPDMTVEQLRNLTFILYSRQYILNLMTGGNTIRIPMDFVNALKRTLPATPGDFTALLETHKALGMKGFDFKEGEFTMTFPFYETEPTKWTAFAELQRRILQAAREATRVFPDYICPEEEGEKYTAHMWLQRLGYRGPEMKEQRSILLKNLHGYCAFSNGSKMQRHKDKYSAIRREQKQNKTSAAVQEMGVTIDE